MMTDSEKMRECENKLEGYRAALDEIHMQANLADAGTTPEGLRTLLRNISSTAYSAIEF